MKKLFFPIIILFSFIGFGTAQTIPKFNLTKDGIKPVILTFEGYTSYQIYNKVKEWVKESFKENPQGAIRADKQYSLIKVGSYKDKGWKIRTNDFDHWYVLEYTLTMEIKDGKCRVTFETPETKYKVWYNSNGTIIPKFKPSEESFEATMNEMLTSLYNTIKGQKKQEKDDW